MKPIILAGGSGTRLSAENKAPARFMAELRAA